MRTNAGELARLRAEVSLLKVRTQELALAVKQDAVRRSTLYPRPAGRTRARAPPKRPGIVHVASDSGEHEILANSILLDAAAREKAPAILALLPETTRQPYDIPEKLVALLLAHDTDARAMQVLGAQQGGRRRARQFATAERGRENER